jgi:hypothetical protein
VPLAVELAKEEVMVRRCHDALLYSPQIAPVFLDTNPARQDNSTHSGCLGNSCGRISPQDRLQLLAEPLDLVSLAARQVGALPIQIHFGLKRWYVYITSRLPFLVLNSVGRFPPFCPWNTALSRHPSVRRFPPMFL